MEKKNRNLLIFVICLVVVIIGFVIGYLIVNENNKKDNTNSDNNITIKKEKLNTITEEELNKKIEEEKYIKIDILANLDKVESSFEISKDKMFFIEGEGTYIQTINGDVNQKEYEIKIVDGYPYYENSKNNTKITSKIKDVKRIYFILDDPDHVLYFLTEKGVLYKSSNPDNGDKELFVNPVKIKSKNKYTDLELLVKGIFTDQSLDYIILGVTSDKKYSIDSDKEYDYVYQIDYIENDKVIKTAYIKENKEVYIDNKKIDKTFKQSFAYYYYNEAPYFITEDNYLYSIKYNDVLTDSKIKNIYYKVENDTSTIRNYMIVFESMEIFEFTIDDKIK